VSRANKLLGASYQLYRHVKTNETIVRTLGYALPAALDGHVQVVAPTTSFDSPQKQWQKTRKHFGGAAVKLAEVASGEPLTVPSSRDDDTATTPELLSWIYGTRLYTPAATDQNVLGIVSFSQYASGNDLSKFIRKYRTNKMRPAFKFSTVVVNGGDDNRANTGALESMEVQYSQGMAYPTPYIFYRSGRGPSGTGDLYLSWLEYIIEQQTIPQTILLPKGNDEVLYSRDHAEYVCDLFAHLGLRGVSVLLASGDDGVGQGNCIDIRSGDVRFLPSFPATCTCGLCLSSQAYTNLDT
jgi:tripeptidyl-peptidase-1